MPVRNLHFDVVPPTLKSPPTNAATATTLRLQAGGDNGPQKETAFVKAKSPSLITRALTLISNYLDPIGGNMADRLQHRGTETYLYRSWCRHDFTLVNQDEQGVERSTNKEAKSRQTKRRRFFSEAMRSTSHLALIS